MRALRSQSSSALLLLVLALLLSPGARAQEAKPVLLDVAGPGAVQLRRGLEAAMGPTFLPVRTTRLKAKPTPQSVRAEARRHAAEAVLVARTKRRAGTIQVTVRVFRGSNGAPLVRLRWKARSERALTTLPRNEVAKLRRVLERSTSRPPAAASRQAEVAGEPAPRRIDGAPDTDSSVTPDPLASAPAEAAPQDERLAEAEDGDEDEDGYEYEDTAGLAPVAARFTVGGRALSRRMQYVDDLRGALPSYRLPAGPALVVGVDWYPGTLLTDGFWSNVGVTAAAEILVAAKSVMPDGTTYNTNSDSYRGGVTARLPLSRGELGLQATFGTHVFAFGESTRGSAQLLVPTVRYRSARAGLFGRVPLAKRLTLVTGAGAHKVWEKGELAQSFFPRHKVGAVDGSLGVQWHLGEAWRLEVGAEYRRYFYAMRPEPGDRFIVGGAVDQYLSGTISMGFELR